MKLPKEMGPGGFFDVNSIGGNIRGILFGILVFLILWYSTDISRWINDLLGIEWGTSSEDRIPFRRFLAAMFGGIIILGSSIYLFEALSKKINRK